jgi:hypothetical protein
MGAYGLERRFAFYDSHNIDGYLHPERGHLMYFRGDVIQVLQRCDDTWAVGLVRGRLGLFPLQHTCSDNFSLIFSSYIARNSEEVSVTKGQVVPMSLTTIPGRCRVYSSTEYGLIPWQHVAPLRPPPAQTRDENPKLYYQYTPLERGHIRLIYITPENVQEFLASGKQSLFLTLTHVPLSKVPKYSAFSYCWGSALDKTPVFCNGKLLYVPSSLWRLLSWHIPGENKNVYYQYDPIHTFREKDVAVFWADAICINQRDTIEKNHQIPLMQTIYHEASQVLVSVGETDSAMGTIVSLDLLARSRQQNLSSGVVPRNTMYDLVSRVQWDAIHRFFSQPIFRRSWVIQEIILSREMTICYGTTRILLSRMHDCALALSESYIRPVNSILGDIGGNRENSTAFNDGIRQLLNLSRVKTTWDQGGIVPFIDLLRQFRSAQVTDPRDKVYSLLSLATEEYRRSVLPDYSPSNRAVDVYEHIARCALHLNDLYSLLPNAGISRKNLSLASWVPDWSYEPREVINGSLFSCSGSWTHSNAYVSPFSHHNRSKLVIYGAIIDTISSTGPRWTPNSEWELPEVLIAKTSGNLPVAFFLTDSFIRIAHMAMDKCGRYPNGDSTSTAIWQTLTCGMVRGERRASPSDEIHYDAFLECLKNNWTPKRSATSPDIEDSQVDQEESDLNVRLENLSLQFGLGTTLNPGPNDSNPPGSGIENERSLLEKRALPFVQGLVRYQAGRRTCVTEKFYFGAVPDEAKKGDLIAIFHGHKLPYVIRRVQGPDADPNQFRLVGHCYVHGIMDGELMEKNQAGSTVISGAEALNLALV